MTDSALIADLVKRYMSEQMAMDELFTDQEQNWIFGHMVTFGHELESAIREKGRGLHEASDPRDPLEMTDFFHARTHDGDARTIAVPHRKTRGYE